MKAAMETLASLPATGRRIAVLGRNARTGRRIGGNAIATSADSWREKCPPDMLICVGPEAAAIASEAVKCGFGPRSHRAFPRCRVGAGAIASRLMPGDLVLLKASRAIGLEAVARAIVAARRNRWRRHREAQMTP